MDDNTPKPFSPRLVGALAFLCSWYPGAVLVALNEERYGRPQRKWPILIAATLLFPPWMMLLMALPDSVNSAMTAVHAGIAVGLSLIQKKDWEAHQGEGGEGADWKLPLLAGAGMLLVLFGFGFGQVMLDDMEFEEARVMIDEGRYAEAEPIFRDYAETWDDAGAWCNLALVTKAQGRDGEALEHLERCIEGDPSFAGGELDLYVRSP